VRPPSGIDAQCDKCGLVISMTYEDHRQYSGRLKRTIGGRMHVQCDTQGWMLGWLAAQSELRGQMLTVTYSGGHKLIVSLLIHIHLQVMIVICSCILCGD
jgi:hypothetical protein